MATFANIYHHRKVAQSSSRACEICYKPSTSVLITPDNKDFFYVCTVHVKEKAFATPIIDEAAVAAREKAKKDAEMEKIKQEVIGEKKRKEEEKKKKEKEKEKTKAETDQSTQIEKDKSTASNTKQDNSESQTSKDASPPDDGDEEPRIFALHKSFYQQRLDKKRGIERARRDMERFRDPKLFPSVPKGLP